MSRSKSFSSFSSLSEASAILEARDKDARIVLPVKAQKPLPQDQPTSETGRVSPEVRLQWICDAAYFKAEGRGFAGGDPLADWLEAEAEIDARLAAQDKGPEA